MYQDNLHIYLHSFQLFSGQECRSKFYIMVIGPDNHYVFFFFHSFSISLCQPDPAPQGTKNSIVGLHSRVKQLHWTVADLPGNSQHTNKGHPHEWINKPHSCIFEPGASAKTHWQRAHLPQQYNSKRFLRTGGITCSLGSCALFWQHGISILRFCFLHAVYIWWATKNWVIKPKNK